MTTTTTRKPFAAGLAAVLSIAGTLLVSFAPAAQVQAADPPSWAPAWGRRDKDNKKDKKDDHKNDRRDDRRDDNRNNDNRDNDRNWRDDRDNRNNDRYNNDRDDRRNDSFRDRFEQAKQQDANRQKTKNDWRNLTVLGGAATVYGLLKGDPTVTFIGAAGTLYSASRYEQDRRSQSNTNRARAELFDRGSFDRDGVHYTKRDKWQNGQHYYYFTR